MESLRQQQERGTVWVAADQHDEPVGFAVAGEVGGDGYLYELDVDPPHGRQGLGRRLVETVCAWARDVRYASVTLGTFIDVDWNAPFYAKLGFVILREEDWTPALLEMRQREAAAGLPMAQRVLMRRQVATDATTIDKIDSRNPSNTE